MIDEAMWDRTMALLDARDQQCNQLIDIVKGRDAQIARLQQETASLPKLLKSVADDPSLLKRPEYQAAIKTLPSTH